MTPAYVGLGSNLDNPELQLQRAITALEALPNTRLDRVSSIYRSAAVGPGTQPDYLNAVVSLATQLSPTELLTALQQIEQAQGRVREVHWGARTIDLDMLLYGEEQISSPVLTVPHPSMHLRNFVLYPLREISHTKLALPRYGMLDALLQQCPKDGLVKTRYRLQINEHLQRG